MRSTGSSLIALLLFGVGVMGCAAKGTQPEPLAMPESPDASGEVEAPEGGICALDEHCPLAEICDGGQCVQAPTDSPNSPCGIPTLHFAHDSARLTPNNQERLSAAAGCLIEALAGDQMLILEATSEPRGATVRDFLMSQGVPAERLRVEARDPAPAQDRRVELRLAPQ
jgi:hypothetical protein